MENFNFVKDERNKLPPGFRLQPTDEEIVFLYLVRKTFSHPLPAEVITEIDTFSFDPWELPGNRDQDKYFFSYKNARETGRGTCSGYWKVTGSTKRIICSESMPIMGIRRTLVFYQGNESTRDSKTDWIMHEYCVALSETSTCNYLQQKSTSQGSLVRVGNWSLCHIFVKTMSSTREDDEDHDKTTTCDFLSDTDSSSVSSSSPHFESSLYNEVSSSMIDHI